MPSSYAWHFWGETLVDWRTIELPGIKLHAGVLGMAVLGNEYQILVVDEIFVVKDVAWIHEDKTVDWLVGPSEEYKQALEKELLKLFWTEVV